ncbi:M20 family metallopeptidase [Jiella mangrovi]|uniref:M20/M25/M40 family metallo-hydrolase n=1 Tax=Jiella mangrovi TaxID=2821407 RepID=A0ABS4BJ94_9HYPH|nr:M20/M25/M40 family metallo-hydrolase [Jiella mangrovi]MBP0616830.1 M20/M25/M40 family metallo-hydrolase [Jiella mangrovi]
MSDPAKTGGATPLDALTSEIIRKAAEGIEAASLDLLKRLIAAAKEGREAIEAVIGSEMKALGLDDESFDYDPADVPLIAEFAAEQPGAHQRERCLVGQTAKGTGETGRSLLLFSHPDPEPYRETPAWATDPFTATVSDGCITGWGVADDLAGIAIMLQSLAVLKAAGLAPAAPLSLVSAPSKSHRRGIAAALHRGLVADAAIYLHPAESGRGLDEIKAFAPGQIEFEVTVEGRLPETNEPAHTAFAHLAVDPFTEMMAVASALKSLDAERGERVRHPLLEAAVGRSTNLLITRVDHGADGGSPRVAKTCRLRAAMSLIPGEDLDAAKGEIAAAIGRAGDVSSWLRENPPRIDWTAGVSAAETDRNGYLYRLVEGALSEAGARPEVNSLHTSSDIRNPVVQRGIPTVGYGPLCGGLTMAGGHDEWVDVADFHRNVAVTARIIAAWCGVRPDG